MTWILAADLAHCAIGPFDSREAAEKHLELYPETGSATISILDSLEGALVHYRLTPEADISYKEMDRAEIIAIARQWAIGSAHCRANVAKASRFAKWYADEYPQGDKPLLDAWGYWIKEEQ